MPRQSWNGWMATPKGIQAPMEARLYDPAQPPAHTTPDWYSTRERAAHLEQPGHRERLIATARVLTQAIGAGATNVCDLGAGDGGLLSLLEHSIQGWGYDLQSSNALAATAHRRVNVEILDVVADRSWEALIDSSTCVVVTEMLEHLLDPHDLVARIYQAGAGFLLASSPYLETPESHYEFHTWAWDQEGYTA